MVVCKKPAGGEFPAPGLLSATFRVCQAFFPHSKFFGGYLLNYLDEDEIHEVDGISGSCMLVRRQVIEQIGYLDERFFAYQEDADYCFQAKEAGWKVVYHPDCPDHPFWWAGWIACPTLSINL